MAGFGGNDGDTPGCSECRIEQYGPGGSTDPCVSCGFGKTSAARSVSAADCQAATTCSSGMIAPVNAVSRDQCVCAPGYGGDSEGRCTQCKQGQYSAGGDFMPCLECPFGFTSTPGSDALGDCRAVANPCPAGREAPAGATSKTECVCQAGFGFYGGTSDAGETCALCPVGTYSTGGTMDACKPCGFGKTSKAGATSSGQCQNITQQCAIGQIAPPGAVPADQCVCLPGYGGQETPSDPCVLCKVGEFSANNGTMKCLPCGFGSTSPMGSDSQADCYPTNQCPAGTYVPNRTGSSTDECVCKPGYGVNDDKETCALCGVGEFSAGGTLEKCRACPLLGQTSPQGSNSSAQCRNATFNCPSGQVAPPGATSKSECACKPGFGGNPENSCTLCPVDFYSVGGSFDPCLPCPWGYTSAAGSDNINDCVPAALTCPQGTTPGMTNATSERQCVCKPGYGAAVDAKPGDGCTLCPTNTYSLGGGLEPCRPCGFGYTSAAGVNSTSGCVFNPSACPSGQQAPIGAVSAAQCTCKPGFGGNPDQATCKICDIGQYGLGGSFDPCNDCKFGFTSFQGSASVADCTPVNECPPGTMPVVGATNKENCVCKPGFGGAVGAVNGDPCTVCPVGTYSTGATMDTCRSCNFGTTSFEGASSSLQCINSTVACPSGTYSLPSATSVAGCVCLPGFGTDATQTQPGSACTKCPQGFFSPGNARLPCTACGFGFTSPAGSTTAAQCTQVVQCPAGTQAQPGATDATMCWCRPGFGTPAAHVPGQPCVECAIGSYSAGLAYAPCQSCAFGLTSPAGSISSAACVNSTVVCPSGTIALPSATTLAGCVCRPGFGSATPGSLPGTACVRCVPGTYSPGYTREICTNCPFPLSSPEGASNASQCTNATVVCPTNQYPLPGAVTTGGCVCKPGTGWSTATDDCQICAGGTFSPGGMRDACTSCPPFQTSAPGSTVIGNCTNATVVCPTNQYALPGAVDATGCVCKVPYTSMVDCDQSKQPQRPVSPGVAALFSLFENPTSCAKLTMLVLLANR